MSKKQAILQAAIKLFSAKGFKESSMAELAHMVGTAGGTIFYHFKNKEELFLSIMENVKTTILKDFQNYTERTQFDNGLEMVEGVISFYLQLTGKMEDQFRLLHRHYPYELSVANPVCRKHLEAIYDCFVDMFERAIERGKNDGSVAGLPVKKTALIIFSMVDGIARFNTYNLYDAGTLYKELLASCRRMLSNNNR
jgi:AcrR family transcriptional regulator